MIDHEQLIIFIVLLIGFALLIIFLRCLPSEKPDQVKRVLKFRKLTLRNGETTELTGEKMKNDISALMDKGFDIASLKELFDFVDDKGAVDSKLFVILNYDSLNAEFEKLSYELAELNANVIFYKPVLS